MGAAPGLTVPMIEAAPVGELRDGAAPGLRLRITPQGRRVFRWAVRRGGKITWVTLGAWSKKPKPGFLTLAEAHALLEKLKAAHLAGKLDELLAELRPRRPLLPVVPPNALTISDLVKDFEVFIARRRRRPEAVTDILDRDVLPVIGDRAVASITTPDVRQVVEAVVKRGASTHAGKVYQVLGQLLRFAQGRGDIASNPADPLDPETLGVENNLSDRFLSSEEIPLFWRALEPVTPTIRSALRLLLLTGVRSGELLQATWEEVDLEAATWTIPVAHQKLSLKAEKQAKPFVIPLPPTALSIMKELQALAKAIGSRFVLASYANDGLPISDKALNHRMRELFTVGDPPALHFQGERPTPHDLRRTVRTHLGETLGIEPHIAERCLNHSLGRISKIYDRGDYVEQRRDALGRWDAFVARLVTGQGAEVVGISAARA